jgi:hypothetical protein
MAGEKEDYFDEKDADENKHLPSRDSESEKKDNEDYAYEKDADEKDDKDYYNDDDDDEDDDDDDDGEPRNFLNYEDLISVSEYVYDPDLDKITNIIFALIKTIDILNCKETSFAFDLTIGNHNEWLETAKLFNENINYCNNYRILIDEDAIVCRFIEDDDSEQK